MALGTREPVAARRIRGDRSGATHLSGGLALDGRPELALDGSPLHGVAARTSARAQRLSSARGRPVPMPDSTDIANRSSLQPSVCLAVSTTAHLSLNSERCCGRGLASRRLATRLLSVLPRLLHAPQPFGQVLVIS